MRPQAPRVLTTRKLVLRSRVRQSDDTAETDLAEREQEGRASYTASLITQGKHRFYTLSMPSDMLAQTCMVEPRNEDPELGFQRSLDRKRAEDIANYIDNGPGTIPSSIVLSAQEDAGLQYVRPNRTLSFNKHPRSFLILDGQHRVYGFRLATSKLRVPVIIYNGLSRTEECRIFIDINTKQRPVPNELLLDIKRLADNETNVDALFRNVFDLFEKEPSSPLYGLLSASERRKDKISRVTFNAAMKTIYDSFSGTEPSYIFEVLGSYIHACVAGLRANSDEAKITNPTLFRALILLFPTIAERVSDRHSGEFSVANFNEVTEPFFSRVKKGDLSKPGASLHSLHDTFRKALHSGFTIGRVRNA
ncbi:MAG TPA: DGQHR domain-containing protein [Lichenihabitans sp.]|nr:DGQHR domain-containing protein [Lichenihabitans sp.]